MPLNRTSIRLRVVFFFVATLLIAHGPRPAFAGDVIENESYSGPKTTIRWAFWGGERTVQLFRGVCERFVEEHPEIAIEVSIYPWGQYWTKLQTQAASGLAPDVISTHSTNAGIWITHGAFAPIEEYVEASDLNLGDYYQAAVENFRWEGSLYAFPIEIDARALIFSIDRLEERGIPPEEWPQPDRSMSWDEFKALAHRLTLRDEKGNVTQFGMGNSFGEWNQILIGMYGGDFLDRRVNPTRPTVVGNDSLQAAIVELFSTQYAERIVPSWSEQLQAEHGGENLLRSTKYAMGLFGPWVLQGYKQDGIRYGITPIPHADVPTQLISVNAVGIFNESRHKDEAWTFIQFLASVEAQSMIAASLRGVPVHRGAREALIENNYGIPQLEAYFTYLDEAVPYRTASSTYIEKAVGNWLERTESLLDAESIRRIRALQEGTGRVTDEQFEAYVDGMREFVATTVRDRWPELDSGIREAFERAERPTPNRMRKVVLPIMIVVLLGGTFLAYIGWVRRNSEVEQLSKKPTNWAAYLCLSPWLAGFIFFTVGPIVASIVLSFTEWNMIRSPIWVGAEHYMNLFSDRYFVLGLKKTFTYAAWVIPISLVGGIFTAGLLTSGLKGTDAFKAIFYFPSLFTGAAAAVLWVNMFNREYGIVNRILSIFGVFPIDWLDEHHAFITVVLMNVFWIGGATIIYYAGMKQIPRTLYEAAEIDGAGMFRRFYSITLPLLSPVILFMVVMTTIGAFQVFTPALFFARYPTEIGKPGDSLRFYSVNIYDEAFNNLHMGKACAWAVVLFIVIFIVTSIQFKLSKRFVHTEV